MSTIYNWDELSSYSGAVDSTNDLVMIRDASDGRTYKVAVSELQTLTAQATASNGGALASTVTTTHLIGTSTSLFVSAPTKVGIWKYIINHSSSTVAIALTASGSSFNTGLSAYTTPGGGSLVLYAISTLKWGIVSHFQTGADTSTSVFLS